MVVLLALIFETTTSLLLTGSVGILLQVPQQLSHPASVAVTTLQCRGSGSRAGIQMTVNTLPLCS